MVTTLKQKIKTDIKNSTYRYYKDTDLYFKDYIYGDVYYTTLEEVVYKFLTSYGANLELDYFLGDLDLDQLVNDLYLHYIYTDKKFIQNYTGSTKRHRKNYIMTSLRNATKPLLVKQFKKNRDLIQMFDESEGCKNLHYISIHSNEGGLLEDLSYKLWEDEKSKKDGIEIQTGLLAKNFRFLNPLQRRIVYLTTKNRSYSDIANILKIDHDKVRKILYCATEKLKARHSFNRRSA